MLKIIWRPAVLLLLLMGIVIFLSLALAGPYTVGDWLVYYVSYGKPALMLYDPDHNLSAPLVRRMDRGVFRFNVDGVLAFSSAHEGNGEIYLVDTRLRDSSPINITQTTNRYENIREWSPDGRYLAFESYYEEENARLYVWDGEMAINITPDDLGKNDSYTSIHWSLDGRYMAFPAYDTEDNSALYVWDGNTVMQISPADITEAAQSYDVAWSADERLAFSVRYKEEFTIGNDKGEIFLWDGHTIINLSQNQANLDSSPVWNTKGELAFVSLKNIEQDIIVWDGTSYKNGLPDTSTFINVAPELTDNYSSLPRWLSDGRLVFGGGGYEVRSRQNYIWDGQTITNISENPLLYNSNPLWSADGRWSFSTSASSEAFFYVRDEDNHTLLRVEGGAIEAWSPSGYLALCTSRFPNYILSVWDGQQIKTIIQQGEFDARWRGDARVSCHRA